MKYLAVDLGNVICKVDFTNFKNKLSKILNLSLEEIDYFLNRTQPLHDCGLTNISDELRDHFKIKSPVIINELMIEWNLTISSVPVMNGVLRSLLNPDDKNYSKIALLSNMGQEHAKLMSNILSKDVYDNVIKFFSYEVGARKPSLLYYKTFLDVHPEFAGCLYIDDREENVDAGKKIGFKAVQFDLNKAIMPEEAIGKILKLI